MVATSSYQGVWLNLKTMIVFFYKPLLSCCEVTDMLSPILFHCIYQKAQEMSAWLRYASVICVIESRLPSIYTQRRVCLRCYMRAPSRLKN